MIHPDDADELEEIARELRGVSLRGPLRATPARQAGGNSARPTSVRGGLDNFPLW